MWHHRFTLSLFSVISVIAIGSSVRGDDSPPTLTPEKAKTLAIRLGSTSDIERANAAKELKLAGPNALLPVLREIKQIKEKDAKLIAKLAAVRTLAFGDGTSILRLTTCDERLKVQPALLNTLVAALQGSDAADQRIAAHVLSLMCFSTNGTAVADIRAACKEVKPETVDTIMQSSVVMHCQSVITTVAISAKPGTKVEMVPMDAYEDQLKAVIRYGSVSAKIIDKLSENADRSYQEWEVQSKRIALLGDDEQWQACVAEGSAYYTLQIVFGQMAKAVKGKKP
jgi:hypothetical protein